MFKKSFAIVSMVALTLWARPVNAQTMDIAAILTQLLNQYQEDLQAGDVTDSLGQVEEVNALGGIAGKLTAMADKLKNMGGQIINGMDKYRPLVDPAIADKLSDPAAVEDFASKNLMPADNSSKGGSAQRVNEIREKVLVAHQAASLEAYGSALASKKLAEDLAKAQADIAEQASDAEDMRANFQMLTAMTTQTIKQLANIQLLQSTDGQVGAVMNMANQSAPSEN